LSSVLGTVVTASPVATMRAGGARRHDVLGTRAPLHVDQRNGEWGFHRRSAPGGQNWLSGLVPLRAAVRAGRTGWASSKRPAQVHPRAGVGQRVQRVSYLMLFGSTIGGLLPTPLTRGFSRPTGEASRASAPKATVTAVRDRPARAAASIGGG